MSKPLALIVEDDPDIGNIFSRAMEAADFQIELIDSGDKALVWLATKVPDVVVLDLQLPRVSGVEILRHIRADPRLAKTPVIVATAYPEPAAFLRRQADRVLTKPVNLGQLCELAMRLYSQDE